jgi:predicted MFS family arabinose efflux permease
VLRVLVIGMSLRAFFGSFFAALYSYYVINDLGLSPAHLGGLVSAGGVGALAGALVMGRLSRRFGLGQLLTVTLLIGSLVGLLTPFAAFAPAPLAFVMMLLPQLIGDAMDMIYEINERSLQQMLIPNDLLGRVNASASFLAQGVAPLGALVGGVLGSLFGAQITLGIAVFGGFSTALWMLASPVRTIRLEPAAGD